MADRFVLPRQSYVFFIAIMAVLLALMWMVFKPFLIWMVTGVFVAVLALPIDRFWERRLKNRLAAMMTMLSLLIILTLPVLGLGLALANDAEQLATAIQEGKHDEWIADGLNSSLAQDVLAYAYPENSTAERNATVLGMVDDLESEALTQLTKIGKDLAAALPRFILATTVILFVVYYVLTDGHMLIGYIQRAAPMPASQVTQLLHEARTGMRAVFVGQILTSTIQGALGGVGFLIAGVPGAIVWAAVMAVLSLLPVVGAFLVWVPAAAFLFFQYSSGEIPLWKPIFLLLWGAIVVSQVDNFIRPKLIGDRANIHPIFVLIGVLGGVAAFGFIGLFLGPLIVGITLSVLRVWETDYLDPLVGLEDPTSVARVAGATTVAQAEAPLQSTPAAEDTTADQPGTREGPDVEPTGSWEGEDDDK